MSPLDDELRNLLGQRAAGIDPSPDPLAGIEQRARRMRRNRVAASVAGAAVVFAAIGLAVPSVLPERDGAAVQFATTPPSPTPSKTATASTDFRLDPANPWAYRGSQAAVANGNRDTAAREWGVKEGVAESSVEFVPLYGEVYEPSQQSVIVYLARSAAGPWHWGVVTGSESGPEFLRDEELREGRQALVAALPADDGVGRLLVVSSPATGAALYYPDGKTNRDMTLVIEGIWTTALDGNAATDRVVVLDGNGDLDRPLYDDLAPDYQRKTRPDNAVAWPTGDYAAPDKTFVDKAVQMFATGMGAKRVDVGFQVLFAGSDDARNTYVFGQAWVEGQQAQTFGLRRTAQGEEIPFIGAVIPADAVVLAFAIPAGTGQSTDTLAVVTAPEVATVEYGAAASEYRSAPAGRDASSVNLVERDPEPEGDKLRLRNTAGKILFEDEVATLLCGIKSCS